MNTLMQRLEVAQQLIAVLVGFLSQPVPPQRAQIQAALDSANSQLQAIKTQEGLAPLAVPQIVPTAPTK